MVFSAVTERNWDEGIEGRMEPTVAWVVMEGLSREVALDLKNEKEPLRED